MAHYRLAFAFFPPLGNDFPQFSVRPYFPVLCDTDENNPIKKPLYNFIEELYIKFRISFVNILCKLCSPFCKIFEKGFVRRNPEPFALS
jgi:hypothetical protein